MQAEAPGQQPKIAGAQRIPQPGAEAQADNNHQVTTDAAEHCHCQQCDHAGRHRQHHVEGEQGDQQQCKVQRLCRRGRLV